MMEDCQHNCTSDQPDTTDSSCTCITDGVCDRPLCCFGVITDVHYADMDNGWNYARTRQRYYRNSLALVNAAVQEWNQTLFGEPVSFVLHLGDLIDGFNWRDKTSVAAADTITSAFAKFTAGPVYYVWGNHELYNFTRAQLLESPVLNPYRVTPSLTSQLSPVTPTTSGYFQLSPVAGVRIVVLDQYEISLLGMDDTWEAYREADKILKENNKNADVNSYAGLDGLAARFVKFNGGVSATQLTWLDQVLTLADQQREIVVVAGHLPISTLAGVDATCLCWNFEEIVATLHRHSCVCAYMAGHQHTLDHDIDERGILHITGPGVIETTPGPDAACHTTVAIYADRLVLHGRGAAPYMVVPLAAKLHYDCCEQQQQQQ